MDSPPPVYTVDFFKQAHEIEVKDSSFSNISQQTNIDHQHSERATINYNQNHWDLGGIAFALSSALKDERIGHVVNSITGEDVGRKVNEGMVQAGIALNVLAATVGKALNKETCKLSNALVGLTLDVNSRVNDQRIGDILNELWKVASNLLNDNHPGSLPSVLRSSAASWKQDQWKEAEGFMSQALDLGKKVLHKADPLLQEVIEDFFKKLRHYVMLKPLEDMD